jgi:hypothetical protein
VQGFFVGFSFVIPSTGSVQCLNPTYLVILSDSEGSGTRINIAVTLVATFSPAGCFAVALA